MSIQRLLARISIALGALLLTLLALEGVWRVAGLAPAPRPGLEGRDTRRSPDPELGYETLPGGRRTMIFRSERGGPERRVDHNVNSLGLRGPERPAGLLPGAFRVACVGDSFTYGHGVSDDETWPAALERALARQPRAQPVVTLNHGVYSFDAEQNARMIETRVADFRPHLVILCWYFNDPAIHGSTAADGLPPPDLLRLLSVQQGGWVAWLRERSYLADWIGHELFVALQRDYYVDSRGGFYDDDSVTWRRSRAALRRARDAARRVGAELAVVLYPALFRDGDELLGREQYAKVAATCDELDVAVFDLAPVFAGRDLDALRVHSHNDHPNGEAHRLAGEALADWLTGRGLVPPSGSGAAADPPPRVSAR